MRSSPRSSRPRSRTRSRQARRRGPVPYLIGAVVVLWLGVLGAAVVWDGASDEAPGDVRPPDRADEQAGSFATEDGAAPGRDAERPDREAPEAEPTPEAPPEADDNVEVDRGREKKESSGTPRLPRAAAANAGGEDPPYDPLGSGADAETLSDTDLSRARLAVFRYVDAAYGFEGSGAADRLLYLEGVNRTVDAPEFWKSPESPGSDPAELIADKTAEYGVENRATFGDFEVEETSSERIIGTASFALDEGGGERRYEQRLVLRRWAAVWRVLYAKPLEEVS